MFKWAHKPESTRWGNGNAQTHTNTQTIDEMEMGTQTHRGLVEESLELYHTCTTIFSLSPLEYRQSATSISSILELLESGHGSRST